VIANPTLLRWQPGSCGIATSRRITLTSGWRAQRRRQCAVHVRSRGGSERVVADGSLIRPIANEDGAQLCQARQWHRAGKKLCCRAILSTICSKLLVAGWSADSLHNPGAIPLIPWCYAGGRGHDYIPDCQEYQTNGQISSDGNGWPTRRRVRQLGSYVDILPAPPASGRSRAARRADRVGRADGKKSSTWPPAVC